MPLVATTDIDEIDLDNGLKRQLLDNFNESEELAANASEIPRHHKERMALSSYLARETGLPPDKVLNGFDRYHKMFFGDKSVSESLQLARNLVLAKTTPIPDIPDEWKFIPEVSKSLVRSGSSLAIGGLAGFSSFIGLDLEAMQIAKVNRDIIKRFSPSIDLRQNLREIKEGRNLFRQLLTSEWWSTTGTEMIPNYLIFGGAALGAAKASALIFKARWMQGVFQTAAVTTATTGFESLVEGGLAVGEVQERGEQASLVLDRLEAMDEDGRNSVLNQGLYESLDVLNKMKNAGSDPELASQVAAQVMLENAKLGLVLNALQFGGAKIAVSGLFRGSNKARLLKIALGTPLALAVEPEQEIRQDTIIDTAIIENTLETAVKSNFFTSELLEAFLSGDREKLDVGLAALVMGSRSVVFNLVSDISQSKSMADAEAKMKAGVDKLRDNPDLAKTEGFDVQSFIDRSDKAKTFDERILIWQEAGREIVNNNIAEVNEQLALDVEERIITEEKAKAEAEEISERTKVAERVEGEGVESFRDLTNLDQLKAEIRQQGGIRTAGSEELRGIPLTFKGAKGQGFDEVLERAKELNLVAQDETDPNALVDLLKQSSRTEPAIKEQELAKITLGTSITFEDGSTKTLIGIDDDGKFMLADEDTIERESGDVLIRGEFTQASGQQVERLISEHGEQVQLEAGPTGQVQSTLTVGILKDLGIEIEDTDDFTAFSTKVPLTERGVKVSVLQERVKALGFGGLNVKIVQRADQVEGGEGLLSISDNTIEGIFNRKTNQVVLIGDRIDPSRVDKVILHEIAGHLGLRAVLGEEGLTKVLEQLKGERGFEDIVSAEEFLARAAEDPNIDPGLLKKIYAAIKQVLRDLGVTVEFTDNDIRVLLARSRVAAQRASAQAVGERADKVLDSDVRFSKAPPVESKAFKDWFKDSKVVGKIDEPLVVYHQTSKENEKQILSSEGFSTDEKKAKARLGDEQVPNGIFFKPTQKDISVGAFGSKAVQIPVYLSIQRPLKMNNRDGLSSFFKRNSREYFDKATELVRLDKEWGAKFDKLFNSEIGKNDPLAIDKELDAILKDWKKAARDLASEMRVLIDGILKREGFDGVIIEEDKGSGGRSTKTYIALKSEQVKSATENVGTFDPETPDIRFSLKDQPQATNVEIERDVRIDMAGQIFSGKKVTQGTVTAALKKAGGDPKRSAQVFTDAKTIADKLTERSKTLLPEQSLVEALKADLSEREKRGFKAGEFVAEARSRIEARRVKARTRKEKELARNKFAEELSKTKADFRKLFSDHLKNAVELEKRAIDWMVQNGIPREEQAKLTKAIVDLAAIKGDKTRQVHFDQILTRAIDLKQQNQKRKDVAKIKAIIKKELKPKTKGKGIKTAPLAEVEELLQTIEPLVGLSLNEFDEKSEGIEKQLEFARADENNPGRVEELETKQRDLTMFGALTWRDPADAARALEILKEFIASNKAGWRAFLEVRKNTVWDPARNAITDTFGLVTPEQFDKRKRDLKGRSTAKRFTDFLNDTFNKSLSLKQKFEKLKDIDPTGQLSLIVDQWNRFFWEGNQKEQTAGRKLQDLINSKANEIYGTKTAKDVENLMVKLSSEKISITTQPKDSTARFSHELSRDQVMYLYTAFMQPQLKDNLEKNGYDETTLLEISESLDSKDIEFAKWMQSHLDKEYDSINVIYKQLFGADMPRIFNYFPFATEQEDRAQTDPDQINRPTFEMAAMQNPNSIIARKKHGIRIKLDQGATQMFMQHKFNMERFKIYALNSKDFFAIIGEQKVKRSLIFHFGETFYKELTEHAAQVVSGGNNAFQRNIGVDKLRNVFIYKALGGNLSVFFKQLTSQPAYYMNMSTTDYVKAIASWPKGLVDGTYTKLIQTDFVQNRWNQGQTVEAMFILQNAKKKGWMLKAIKAGMFTTRVGDLAPILMMGNFIYNKAFAEAKSRGLSDVEAGKYAEFLWGSMTEETQQSSAWKDRTHWQRAGSYGLAFSMFQTTPRQYFTVMGRALQKAYIKRNMKDPKARADAAKAALIFMVILPAAFTFAGNAFRFGLLGDDDEREEWWPDYLATMLKAPINGIYFARFFAAPFDFLTGTYRPFGEDMSILGLDDDVVSLFKAGQSWSDDDIQEAIEDIVRLVPAVNQIYKIGKRVTE